MASTISLKKVQLRMLALGEVTARDVFEYDADGNRSTVRKLGPSGKPLFAVGPLAVEMAGTPLGEVRTNTETPEAFEGAVLGSAFVAVDAEVAVRNNRNGFDLGVTVLAPVVKKAGGQQ